MFEVAGCSRWFFWAKALEVMDVPELSGFWLDWRLRVQDGQEFVGRLSLLNLAICYVLLEIRISSLGFVGFEV